MNIDSAINNINNVIPKTLPQQKRLIHLWSDTKRFLDSTSTVIVTEADKENISVGAC